LLWAYVQNEVTSIHKFYRREIWFVGTFYVSFSYELRARKSLNWFNLQGSEKPEVTLFFAFDRCEGERCLKQMLNPFGPGLIFQRDHVVSIKGSFWLSHLEVDLHSM